MNETSSSDAYLASTNRTLRRLKRLVIASVCLNALILLLLLLGAIKHPHPKSPPREGRDFGRGEMGNRGEEFERGDEGRDGGGEFHHHHFRDRDRGEWGGHDRHMGGGEEDERGWSGDKHSNEGFGGGDGGMRFEHHGWGGGETEHHGPDFEGQNPPDPAATTDMILAHMTEELTLSDDQKAKIKPILSQEVIQFQKDMETHRQEMQKQVEDDKAKIKPLLNADQQKQLDALPTPGQKPPGQDAAMPNK